MMPQTVPNRPTNGAVEPMVASTPVPRDIRRRRGQFDARQARSHPFLEPLARGVPERCRRQRDLLARSLHQHRDGAGAAVERGCRLAQRRRPADRRQCLARPQPRAGEFDRLDQPHRPGDQRCEGEPQHHRFHHDVGCHEHAHRRQVLRQVEAAEARRAASSAGDWRCHVGVAGAEPRNLKRWMGPLWAFASAGTSCAPAWPARNRVNATTAATLRNLNKGPILSQH